MRKALCGHGERRAVGMASADRRVRGLQSGFVRCERVRAAENRELPGVATDGYRRHRPARTQQAGSLRLLEDCRVGCLWPGSRAL